MQGDRDEDLVGSLGRRQVKIERGKEARGFAQRGGGNPREKGLTLYRGFVRINIL
jgi:hypothetical protein